MKILILADPAAPHTIKWVNSLSKQGIEIYLFGLSYYDKELYNKNVKISSLNASLEIKNKPFGSYSKIIYLTALRSLKKIIKEFKPDIVHSHFASSFGLIGALSGFHPFIISVWGTDIYNFPERSFLHKRIIEYNLSKADKILSTSKAMALQTRKFTDKEIEITPFGIDVNKFKPGEVDSIFNKDDFIIGTIKTLEKKYGVEYLIKAFKLVKNELSDIRLKLLVVGGGSLLNELKHLTKELKIEKDTIFSGFIVPDKIPAYHNMLDVFVSLSIEDSESFGVAVIEASACEKPVVVSHVGGFPEVVENNVTGIIVEKENVKEAADAMLKLIKDKYLREEMGKAGRKRVIKYFNWDENVTQMLNIYRQVQ
ncbi:glycosyltransferase [bacterium BMS3Abin03]|nr:glycosyltransferase [bacterium BMS3Abin03]